MYHAFYRLHTDPFRLTPDPAFCFRHERYARALAYMQYALQQGEGFIMVTGLPGTGKTTLIEHFHSEFKGARTLVAKLISTQLQADELLRLICLSLGVSIEAQDKASLLHRLREFFVEQAKKGRRTLLLIDEAQDLPMQALEELRLLGNLQQNARPLLQIFLVGQEQLMDVVRLPAMRPLFQRMVAACHLEPLTLDETRAYIEYRLNRAGWNSEPAFDERSYRMIHRFTEGFPRQINKVCSRLLLYGSTEKKQRLDCFDCLKVLRHLLEELPGSSSDSIFQACVEMLNASWSAANDPGSDAVAVAADASLPLAGQEQTSPGECQSTPEPEATAEAKVQVTAEATGEAEQAAPVERQRAALTEPTTPPLPDAGARDDATDVSRRAPAEAMPAGESAPPTGVDRQPAPAANIVPVNTARSRRPARRPPQGRSTPAQLHTRAARHFGAPVGLLAALVVALLFVASDEDGGTGDLAGAPDVSEMPGSMVVARLEPEALPTPSDSAPVPEVADPDDSVDSDAGASLAELATVEAPPEATEPVDAAIEVAGTNGDSTAGATLVHDEQSLAEQGPDQHASPDSSEDLLLEPAPAPEQALADALPAHDGGVPGTDLAPDTLAGPVKFETAANIEAQVSVAEAAQVPAPDELAAAEAADIGRPLEPQVDAQHEPVDAVPDSEAEQASAEQQRIDQLMARAERALRADRLTVPRGNNAHHYYRQVLKIAPQHRGARAGMQRIASRYSSLIERALATDDMDKARRYVARGLMVSPGNRELLALQQDVETRESWLKAQAALAAAEAEARRAQPPPPEKAQPQSFLDKLKEMFSNPVPRDMP